MLKVLLSLLISTYSLANDDCSKYFLSRVDFHTHEFMERQNQLTAKSYESTNFKSSTNLIKALNNTSDPMTKKIWNFLKSDDSQFAMQINPNNLEEIALSEKFKNLWEVYGQSWHKLPESVMTGTYKRGDFSKFDSLIDEIKPKYGYLRSSSDKFINPDIAESYGSSLVILKKDKLINKTTFTAKDSHAYQGGRSSGRSLDERDVESFMIPWEKKELLVPLIRANSSNVNSRVPIFPSIKEDYVNLKNLLPNDLKKFKIDKDLLNSNYVELQFWGELDFSYIEKYYFKQSPPDGVLLEKLKKHNIPIYDARNTDYQKAIPWE